MKTPTDNIMLGGRSLLTSYGSSLIFILGGHELIAGYNRRLEQ